MKTVKTTWEDEENNRIVELEVEYDLSSGELTIERIVPRAIAFVCETTGNVQRRIGVHTSTGRKMLARQLAATLSVLGDTANVNHVLSAMR